ncbi:MAG: hypothetical protein F6J97_11715 [Leptolyngbya sp. SIO4C1]|nr:hypothetical protein [Leptolyngbya sp. SIO4C1]
MRTFTLMLLSLMVLLAVGCSYPPATEPDSSQASPPTEVPQPAEEPAKDALPEAVSEQVKSALSQSIGVSQTQLDIADYSQETWSDGCLGLGGPAESCLAALTEGWRVEVVNRETSQRYVYRTDEIGDSMRRESPDTLR